METRSSYVVVGAFVLTMVAVLFAMVVYIAKIQFDEKAVPYHIYFSGSVTGLQEGSAVRYRGISMGVVSDIRVAADDATKVQVTVELPESAAITEDAVATIEMQGITGIAYIQLVGGAKGSPKLQRHGHDIPVIPSQPSQISEVFDAAPQVLNRLIMLSDRFANFLTPENADNFGKILQNTESMTASGRKALDGVTKVTDDMASAAQEARKLIDENREPLRDFTTTGLYDAALLIAELRELVGSMSHISTQVQRDPSGFLFAGPRTGVELKADPSPATTNNKGAR